MLDWRYKETTAINTSVITTQQLRPYLQRCGYTDRQLRENYTYTDDSVERTVPLAGFHQTFDAREACVAGLDANSQESSRLEEKVADYTGLGAPILFACCQKELQWWKFTPQGPKIIDTVPADKLANFFNEHRKEFRPESIYRAKTLGRIDSHHQLSFVDIGLMPVLEEKMGQELAKLMGRMLNALHSELGSPNVDKKIGRWMFEAAFWLLAAKMLKEKGVEEFNDLDLEDIFETLRKVHNHYNAGQPSEKITNHQQQALQVAANIVKKFSSLANVTIESLAYVYENTLITKEIRKALGIHATPSYLVDYIVWKLAPWIDEHIHKEDRIVLEPACGHAPFLVSAARFLRELIDEDSPKKRHDYLKDHLLGVEIDPFAQEIARLSLTLADVPNPNGWRIKSADVFEGQALSDAAAKCAILLCNPPFEDFTPAEKASYENKGMVLRYGNKAAEVLDRTLPYMPVGSVFGVVLPQGFLHASGLAPLRKLIVEHFELSEILALPENVFASAKHKSAIILGRKRKTADKQFFSNSKVCFSRIQNSDLQRFMERYESPIEEVFQSKFDVPETYDFRLPILYNVWEYCQHLPHLATIAYVGKGLEYKGKDLPVSTITVSEGKFPRAVRGYARFEERIRLTETPKTSYMSLNPEVIRRPGLGLQSGISQILLNYARVSVGPWRLKALIDREGHPATSNYLLIRPKTEMWSLEAIWAILNSPFVNAYAYCNSLERDNLVKMVRSIPLPECDTCSLRHLGDLVKDYFALFAYAGMTLRRIVNEEEDRKQLLAIDAEVMRLYDLPPRLERQLLDLFDGWERKGVDFRFTGYFPKGFESFIPLHEYLSEEYQRSTVSFVSNWVEEVRSPEVIKALEKAVEIFKED